jgi:hypothetical protein
MSGTPEVPGTHGVYDMVEEVSGELGPAAARLETLALVNGFATVDPGWPFPEREQHRMTP